MALRSSLRTVAPSSSRSAVRSSVPVVRQRVVVRAEPKKQPDQGETDAGSVRLQQDPQIQTQRERSQFGDYENPERRNPMGHAMPSAVAGQPGAAEEEPRGDEQQEREAIKEQKGASGKSDDK